MRCSKKWFTKLFVLTVLLAFGLNAWSAKVTVVADNIKSLSGNMVVLMFSQEANAGWPDKEDEASCKLVTSVLEHQITQVCQNVLPGIYAVIVFHDVNSNGKLDHGILGPKEPYGFSNGARGLFGPAKFIDSQVDVPESDITLKIRIK